MQTANPESLMPGDWGMFTCSMDCSMPKAVLDDHGCKLVRAIWGGNFEEIKTCVENICKLQSKFAKYGAMDTEGRHALWDLMQRACETTPLDPEKLWNQTYEACAY